jgi:hypothetical protein
MCAPHGAAHVRLRRSVHAPIGTHLIERAACPYAASPAAGAADARRGGVTPASARRRVPQWITSGWLYAETWALFVTRTSTR